jgi:hypothetical protein
MACNVMPLYHLFPATLRRLEVPALRPVCIRAAEFRSFSALAIRVEANQVLMLSLVAFAKAPRLLVQCPRVIHIPAAHQNNGTTQPGVMLSLHPMIRACIPNRSSLGSRREGPGIR